MFWKRSVSDILFSGLRTHKVYQLRIEAVPGQGFGPAQAFAVRVYDAESKRAYGEWFFKPELAAEDGVNIAYSDFLTRSKERYGDGICAALLTHGRDECHRRGYQHELVVTDASEGVLRIADQLGYRKSRRSNAFYSGPEHIKPDDSIRNA